MTQRHYDNREQWMNAECAKELNRKWLNAAKKSTKNGAKQQAENSISKKSCGKRNSFDFHGKRNQVTVSEATHLWFHGKRNQVTVREATQLWFHRKRNQVDWTISKSAAEYSKYAAVWVPI